MHVVRPSTLSCIAMASAVLAGCSGAEARESIQVFAAASLTEAFAEFEAGFEAENPEVDVVLNLGGSSSLREQIRAGAPADVFASANAQIAMTLADEDLLAAPPRVFATNSLVIAVPEGNPAGVTSASDLEADELLVGLCAAAVPCGELALETLEHVGVEASIDTSEPDVRALLTKIELGELDAGLVYYTDVLASNNGVESIVVADAPPTTSYPIAPVADAPNPGGAAAFVDFVLSQASREVLARRGFGDPE